MVSDFKIQICKRKSRGPLPVSLSQTKVNDINLNDRSKMIPRMKSVGRFSHSYNCNRLRLPKRSCTRYNDSEDSN